MSLSIGKLAINLAILIVSKNMNFTSCDYISPLWYTKIRPQVLYVLMSLAKGCRPGGED